ncbi:MAG: hypothetical protein GX675_03670 [Erysipelotrichaceae bacterium]|nr:hypothetical protein [Erysipelotrichaceae bacterium]
MNSTRYYKLAIIIMIAMLIFSCSSSKEYGDTKQFGNFLKIKKSTESIYKKEVYEDYTYILENGILSFLDLDGKEIWRSDPYWFIDDFQLFDINGDGRIDCLFSLWKSYSFYKGVDKNDDPSVKNHLFLYTIIEGHAKSLWGSSNLPRPIYSFQIIEGTPNPVSTGAILKTIEGEYTKDYSKTEEIALTYTWQGWGFVPEN